MHKSKLKRVSIAVCMALLPVSLFAAGLGKLNVSSGLGEPLRAEIELISVTSEELSSLTAAIANDEAYATQGIERPSLHNNIQIELTKNSNGSPILKLKTNQPVNDPFLDMLIQVDWASGRLLREYTLLLDPPGYTEKTDKSNLSQSIQAPVSKYSPNSNSQSNVSDSSNVQVTRPANDSNSADLARKDGNKSKNISKKSKDQLKARPEKLNVDTEANQDTYTTKRGDTLSSVAKQMQIDGISLDQMLIGLYEENPNAFAGNNMNRLKAGQIIRAPSPESLSNLSQNKAHAEVKLQSENWNSYRNKLAGVVENSKPTAEDTSKESTSGRITSAAEDKAASMKTAPKDIVKLSTGDVKSNANSQASTKADAEKIAKQEDAIAKEKALKDEQDKTAALAKIQQTKDLLALRNKQMADMQKQAKDNAIANAKLAHETQAPANTVKPIILPEAAKAQMPKIEPGAPIANQAKPPVVSPEKIAEKATVTDASTRKDNKPKLEPIVKTPVTKPANFLDEILNGVDTTMLSIGAGILALLAGGWLLLRNKRRRNLANFEQGILTSGGLRANTVFGNTTGGKVDTGDTSFLTDFSQSSSGSMIDTNDVDPIAEAEVYMAYGREAQAEEILKDAIAKEPKRYELHLKLLEMYAARNDTAAFETIAGELYTTLGAHDPTWAKVAEMGLIIEPDNPLYQGANVAVVPGTFIEQPTKNSADNFSEISHLESKSSNLHDIDFAINEVSNNLDDFDSVPAKNSSAAASVEKSSGIDFDLGALGSISSATALQADNQAASKSDPNLIDDGLAGEYVSSANAGVDFNLDDFGTISKSTKEEPPIIDEDKFTHTLPVFSMPNLEPVKAEDNSHVSDINFDLPNIESIEHEKNSRIAEDFDFNFTLPDVDDKSIDEAPSEISEFHKVDVKPLDFTGVSLDLSEPETSIHSFSVTANELPSAPLPTVEDVASGVDSEDVETKLDLVNAYLEMEDHEGAKELLEEVLKEGSIRQIAKARELLANIV